MIMINTLTIIVSAMKRKALLMRSILSYGTGICRHRLECSSKAFCISDDRTPNVIKFPSSGKRGRKPNQLKGERLLRGFQAKHKTTKMGNKTVDPRYGWSMNKSLDGSDTCRMNQHRRVAFKVRLPLTFSLFA